jgi:ubiquinone biosynthesis monooxygenase Coq7
MNVGWGSGIRARVHGSRGLTTGSRSRDEKLRALRDRMLRVDHAGEYGANRIYAGQMAVLGESELYCLQQQQH